MFKLVGVLVALYTLYAVFKGEVYAKSGLSGRSVSKATPPRYFWVVITI
jgi:hypothetical protein